VSDTPKNLANFIWQVADLLRGEYKRADYGKAILPFTVLRRLECVLEPTRKAVREEKAKWEAKGIDPAPFLPKVAGYSFYNTTEHTLESVAAAPDDAAMNLTSYVAGFSENAREVFDRYRFAEQVAYLGETRLQNGFTLDAATRRSTSSPTRPGSASNASPSRTARPLSCSVPTCTTMSASTASSPRSCSSSTRAWRRLTSSGGTCSTACRAVRIPRSTSARCT